MTYVPPRHSNMAQWQGMVATAVNGLSQQALVTGSSDLITPLRYGAVGDGITDDTAAFQAALNAVAARGGGVLTLLNRTYKVTTLSLSLPDVTIDARGAIVTSAITSSAGLLAAAPAALRTKVIGGTWKLTGGTDQPWFFTMSCPYWELNGVRCVKTPDAGGYQSYFHYTGDGGQMRGCRWEGSNGFYIEASDSAFLGNAIIGRASGGDDCFAIKGISDNVRNIRIEGNYIESLASGLSIGSEIGAFAANDATYSRTVGQVVFSGNTLKNCATIAYIKPGGISAYDYRDGTVEAVVISNNTLTDEAGTKFERGIAITPARGARVRNVYGRNNVIRARTVSGAGRPIGALDIYILDYAGGTTDATAQNINVEVDFRDIYDGLSNSGARPGYPAQYVASVNRLGVVGTVSDITINVRGSGSSEAGFVVGNGLTANAIRVENLQLTNVNQTNAVGQGGVYLLSDVYLGTGYWSVTPAFGTEMSGTGVLTGTLSVARGGTGGGTASGTLLDNIAGFSSTGQLVRTAAGTYAFRTLTAPASGITVTNGNGVAGNPTLALANDLSALEALSGTNTIYYRSAADTWSAVTINSDLSFASGTLKNTVYGAMVKKSADQTAADYSAGSSMAFDAEVYDAGGWHDNVTNNTRLSVPSGVAYVEVGATITFGNVTAGTDMTAIIRRNGVTSYDGTVQMTVDAASASPINLRSGPIQVTGGTDYFEVFVFAQTDTSIDIVSARTNFWIKAVG